jgi:tetratricopeptide (TPR) repeat protein
LTEIRRLRLRVQHADIRSRSGGVVTQERDPAMTRFNEDEMKFAPVLDAALAARDRGDFDESVALFRSIIERAGPSCRRLLGIAHGLLAGVYYNQLDDANAALPHARESVRFTPRSELGSLGLFHCFASLGRWEEAFEEAIRLLSVRGDSADYRMIVADDTFLGAEFSPRVRDLVLDGRRLIEQWDETRAVKIKELDGSRSKSRIDLEIETEPTIDELVREADRLEEKGDVLGATEALSKAIHDHPSVARLLARRGRLHYLRAQWKDAIADFSAALALQPSAPSTLLYRGQARAHLEDFDEALHDFYRVTVLEPRAADAFYEIGYLQNFRGRSEEARSNWRFAMTLEPEWKSRIEPLLAQIDKPKKD